MCPFTLKALYLSQNGGFNWTRIKDQVASVRWYAHVVFVKHLVLQQFIHIKILT